jgi:glycosyltransferase involved in cell wall biosynthesis
VYQNHRIAVVVPAFNEADKIAQTLASIPAFVDDVIVVDDGSRDNTAALAAAFVRHGLEVVGHTENLGVGAAIVTGYRRALALGCDVVAVMAGDSQMCPGDLPGLLDPVCNGNADYAKGNRFAWTGPESAFRLMPFSRWFGNVFLSHLTRLATGNFSIFDSQCGYTAASREALAVVVSGPVFRRYGYPNALLIRLCAARLTIKDVAVRPVYGPTWRSGIRPHAVALPILALLWRGWKSRFSLRGLLGFSSGEPRALHGRESP